MSKNFEVPVPGDDCNTCDLLKAALPPASDQSAASTARPGPFGVKPPPPRASVSQRLQAAANRQPRQTETPNDGLEESTNFWAPDPPPGLVEIGHAGWTTLHTMAAYYPDSPSEEAKTSARGLMKAFATIFPCGDCAQDLASWMTTNPPQVDSQRDFSQWMCNTHNHVNRHLGKPEFDCRLVDRRWSRLPKHQTPPKPP